MHCSITCMYLLYYIESLDKYFVTEKNCKCVLDYMKNYHNEQNYIYRNYLLLFHQVFDALNYLQTQQVVHRDVKRKL